VRVTATSGRLSLRDVGLLVRAHEKLLAIPRMLDVDADVAEAKDPEAMMEALSKNSDHTLTSAAAETQ